MVRRKSIWIDVGMIDERQVEKKGERTKAID